MRDRRIAEASSGNRATSDHTLLDVEHHRCRYNVLVVPVAGQGDVDTISAWHEQQLRDVAAEHRAVAAVVVFIAPGRCGAVEGRDRLPQRVIDVQCACTVPQYARGLNRDLHTALRSGSRQRRLRLPRRT